MERPFTVCQNSVLLLLLCDVGNNVMKVVEHGLGHLPFTEKQVVTPTGTLRRDIPHNHKVIAYTIVSDIEQPNSISVTLSSLHFCCHLEGCFLP